MSDASQETLATPTIESFRANRFGRPALAAVVVLVMVLSSLAGLAGAVPVAASSAPAGTATHAAAPSTPSMPLAAPNAGAPFASTVAPTNLLTHSLSMTPVPLSLGTPLAQLSKLSGAPQALPAGASTASNYYVCSYCEPGAIQQMGGSNQSLISTFFGINGLVNGTSFFATHGTTGIGVSKNGGESWTVNWPGQNASWSSSTSVNYGDVLDGMDIIDTGYGVPNLFPSLALNVSDPAKGMTVLSTYGPECFYTGCASANQYNASSGFAVSHSVDGVTWSNPTPLSAMPFDRIDFWNGACNVAAGAYITPAVQPSSLAITEGPNNHVYAAWTTIDFFYPLGHGMNGLIWCDTSVSPNVAYYGYDAPGGALIYNLTVASSSNGGLTWTTPVVVDSQSFATSKGIYLDPAIENPSITVGPAPNDLVTMVFTDLTNITTNGLIPIMQVSSSNSGSSWSKPVGTGVSTNWVRDSTPDWFLNYTQPIITTDNWSNSFYRGNEYMVWNDNRTTPQTAGASGYPSVGFSVNASGSGHWSTPVFISSDNPNTTRYFMPTVSVEPNGWVWVEYYASVIVNGNYHLYGVYSKNGGSTWSAQFTISDAASTPGSAPNAMWTGTVPNAVGTSAGDYVQWLDCRAINCNPGGNTTVYMALVDPFSVSTNAANTINVTIAIGGLGTTYPLAGPTGVLNLGVDVNATLTVTVPGSFPSANGTYIDDFQSFTGAVTSTNDPVQFSFHGGALLAKYTLVPGAWIDGTVTPAIGGTAVRVQAPGSTTLVPKLTLSAGVYTFNQTVAGGVAYYVNITAPKYNESSQLVPTVQLKVAPVSVTLGKEVGWIAGSVNPKNAKVEVQDTVGGAPGYPTLSAAGHFNVSRVWGSYWVNASLAGYKTCSEFVNVYPGQTNHSTVISPCFLWGSHLTGTVNPPNANVTIDGNGTNVQGGIFNASLPGNTSYVVRATLFGYSVFDQAIVLPTGVNKSVSISLTNRGWITGTVGPVTANPSIDVDLNPQTVVDGAFNISELASNVGLHQDYFNYTVTALAPGYVTQTLTVKVTPGNTTPVIITLKQKTTVVNNTCPNASNPLCQKTSGGGNSTAPNYTLVYVGVAVIVVLVAVIALALLMRRGKGGQAAPAAPAPAGPGNGGASPPTPP